MDKTVQIVNKWAEYAEKHPAAGIQDFCRYYLTKEREKVNTGDLLGGIIPPADSRVTLNKLVVFIARIHAIYANIAMEGIQMKQFEEFHFLNTIYLLGSPRKTEVIYHTMNELSTGLNILNSLKDQGYITEEDDLTDKRSKRVRVTQEGVSILTTCRKRFAQLSELLFNDMAEEDSLLCIQLLKNIEIKFARLWQQHKGQKFEDIYDEVITKKGEK